MSASSAPNPPVSFSTFLVSLASAALAHLGEVASPAPAPIDTALARQTMEVIDMLAEKTKGNLDEEEASLLAALQKELKERYDARVRTASR